MTFTQLAAQMAGQVALLLGWRPDDFWNATPAELTTILSVMSPAVDGVDAIMLQHLMKEFPDAHIANAHSGGD